MTTSHVTSDRNELAGAAEVRTRRVRAPEVSQEVYGGENLPVLIRLPDLSAAAAKAVAKPVLAPADTTKAAANARNASPPASRPAPCAADRASTPARDGQMDVVAKGRVRRGGPRSTPARPSGGVRQYLLAVLLAVGLFALIVTIKESRQAASAKKPPAGRAPIEAPAAAVGPSLPSSTVDIVPPELAPSVDRVPDLPRGPVETVLETSEPVAPDAAGYADGAVQVTEYYDRYPSTHVEPVQPRSVPAESAPTGVWPAPVHGRPLWSADRHSTDAPYQQR